MRRPLSVALAVVTCAAVAVGVRWVDARTLDAVDPSADTILLGASVTYRWPERAPESYARVFGPRAQNLAIPGLQTWHLSANLPIHTDADMIWLDIGGADLIHGREPLDVAVDVAGIVDTLVTTTTAHVYVAGILPHPGGDERVEAANAWVAELLRGYRPDRVTVVPLWLGPQHLLVDGKHPSAAGYLSLERQAEGLLEDDRAPKVANL